MKEVNRIYENLSDAYTGIDSIEIAGEILSQLATLKDFVAPPKI